MMWTYVSSVYHKVNYIRKSRETFESRNRNLTVYLAEYVQGPVEEESPKLTLLSYGSDTTIKSDKKFYEFKFKNLVLAGGGAKGVAYCGVARALEEHGILKDIRRFAGTSAGSIVAALLCMGFNSYDIEHIMSVKLDRLVRDESSIKKWLNLFRYFGMHPANKFKEFMGDVFAMKTKNRNITFKEVYEHYEKELCIIVTNANTMSEEYCHVTTTPNMPIRDAVRMSISLPGEFQAVNYTMFGDTSMYVDGGVLCNYPIHCFDGWYLSTTKNLPVEMYKAPFKSRKTNFETLGCLVYSEDEHHIFRDQIEKKCTDKEGKYHLVLPNTQLSRKWKEIQDQKNKKIEEFNKSCDEATTNFLNIFNAGDQKKEFSLEEFEDKLLQAWVKEGLEPGAKKDVCRRVKTYAEMLYGPDVNPKKIFKKIDKNDNNKVTQDAINKFACNMRDSLEERYKYVTMKRQEIDRFYKSFVPFIVGLTKASMMNFFKENDVARTIGINTKYISMTDFALEDGDRKFLIGQGKRSTEEFLKHFVRDHGLKELDSDIKSTEVPKKTSLSKEDKSTEVPTKTSLSKEDLAKIKRYHMIFRF